MLRVAFAGTPEFALPALEALAGSAYTLVGVLTQPDRPAGRGRELNASPVKRRAAELGLPIAQPVALRSVEERAPLVQWGCDLLVVVAYGLLLPAAVLELPGLGCLNIHASLLPRWRGAAPIQRAILAGDRESGVSIMQMDAGLDTGAVLAQRPFPIADDTDTERLQAQLAPLGASLLLETIAALERGDARAVPQSDAEASYARKLDKREARIDWQRSAEEIARQVRAFNPWPVAETLWGDQRLRIWRAQAVTHPVATQRGGPGEVLGLIGDALHVACGQGVLAVSSLQLAGRRALAAAEFIRGQPVGGARLV